MHCTSYDHNEQCLVRPDVIYCSGMPYAFLTVEQGAQVFARGGPRKERCGRHLLGQSLHGLTIRMVDELACGAQLPGQALAHRKHEAVIGNEEGVALTRREVHELLFLLGNMPAGVSTRDPER